MATNRSGRKLSIRARNNIEGYAFAMPYIILLTVFTILPVLIAFVLSFTRFNMLQAPKFLFLDNYLKLFLDDEIFPIGLKNTLIFAAITGPVSYVLCFFFAWCLNELNPVLRSIFTFMLYSPSISGNAYLIWTLIFSGDSYGYANGILMELGIIYEPILWFQNTSYMIPILLTVILWMSLGTSFLVFIAGFQGIDRSLYEAAAVDGVKNRWQELWYVTLPSMKPQLVFSAVMSITGAFSIGDVITGLAGFPTTDYTAHTLMHHLQDYGNTRFEMGYASSIATLIFAITILCNGVINKIIRKVGE